MKTLIRGSIGMLIILSMNTFAALPDWILNPPDEPGTIYGIGEARSLSDSERDALTKILGNLKTTVSSTFGVREQLVNDAFARTINQNVSSQIDKLPISQYKVEKRHQEDNVIYTLVSVSKAQLADTFVIEVESGLASAQRGLAQRGAVGSELEWWMANKDTMLTQYASNLRYLSVLASLDYPVDALAAKNKAVEDQLLTLRTNNCLFVLPNNNNKIRLALREQIVASGLPADDQNCRNTIQAQDNIEQRVLFKQNVATVTLTLTLFQNNNPLAEETMVETGKSSSGEQVAQKAAYSRLVSAIKQDEGTTLRRLLSN